MQDTSFQSQHISAYVQTVDCSPNLPCVYPEQVDFRIIVITYNRANSTRKALQAIDSVCLDGATSALEIWIDQSKSNFVHYPTVEVARTFKWSKGPTRVHVQGQHVGIYGQWIDTWKPNGRELALILEDDINVSPYVWRWVKAVHKTFGNRDDVFGYCIQNENVIFPVHSAPVEVDPKYNVFLHRLVGSWGFIPHPKVWSDFQKWFHSVRKVKTFKPYIGVDGHIFDRMYKRFEKKGTADSMWTEWFVRYTNDHNLYCVYNNLVRFTNSEYSKLAINRKETGLHFHKKGIFNEDEILTKWNDSYIKFPAKIPRLEFNHNIALVDI